MKNYAQMPIYAEIKKNTQILISAQILIYTRILIYAPIRNYPQILIYKQILIYTQIQSLIWSDADQIWTSVPPQQWSASPAVCSDPGCGSSLQQKTEGWQTEARLIIDCNQITNTDQLFDRLSDLRQLFRKSLFLFSSVRLRCSLYCSSCYHGNRWKNSARV